MTVRPIRAARDAAKGIREYPFTDAQRDAATLLFITNPPATDRFSAVTFVGAAYPRPEVIVCLLADERQDGDACLRLVGHDDPCDSTADWKTTRDTAYAAVRNANVSRLSDVCGRDLTAQEAERVQRLADEKLVRARLRSAFGGDAEGGKVKYCGACGSEDPAGTCRCYV